VINAGSRLIQLKSRYNIRVIALSLGRPVVESYKLDPLGNAREQAWKAGIVVFVAGGNTARDHTFGNDGSGTIAAAGDAPYVLTVGANGTKLPQWDRMFQAAQGGDGVAQPSISGHGQSFSCRAWGAG
jgi:serine protease AprX